MFLGQFRWTTMKELGAYNWMTISHSFMSLASSGHSEPKTIYFACIFLWKIKSLDRTILPTVIHVEKVSPKVLIFLLSPTGIFYVGGKFRSLLEKKIII